jgi:hypothetical protein
VNVAGLTTKRPIIITDRKPRPQPVVKAQASKITEHVITAKRPGKRYPPFLRAQKGKDD